MDKLFWFSNFSAVFQFYGYTDEIWGIPMFETHKVELLDDPTIQSGLFAGTSIAVIWTIFNQQFVEWIAEYTENTFVNLLKLGNTFIINGNGLDPIAIGSIFTKDVKMSQTFPQIVRSMINTFTEFVKENQPSDFTIVNHKVCPCKK